MNRLTAVTVKNLNTKGRYADGGGLYLRVGSSTSKSWVYRWVRNGTENEMGLGAYPAVSLADARETAAECRRHVAAKRNPRVERDREREAARTFGEAADEFLIAKASNWNNEKTRWQWKHTLTEFAAPIRRVPVAEIDTADVLKLLKPIWTEKPETAAKSRMRLEAVLDYASAHGWRSTENPARWRGHLANMLPKRQKLTRGHHPAMPYQEVDTFMGRLAASDAMSANALRFLILTAGRTGEVLNATWDEIDFDEALWTIPGARMRDHRVPLTDAALAILNPLHGARVSDFVFPGQKQRRPLSNLAMEMLMRRMKVTDASPHGFRSSFRDWAGDKTAFPREIAEQALAHKVGDEVELAYRRGDALEKRRQLMSAWADFVTGNQRDNVVALHG